MKMIFEGKKVKFLVLALGSLWLVYFMSSFVLKNNNSSSASRAETFSHEDIFPHEVQHYESGIKKSEIPESSITVNMTKDSSKFLYNSMRILEAEQEKRITELDNELKKLKEDKRDVHGNQGNHDNLFNSMNYHHDTSISVNGEKELSNLERISLVSIGKNSTGTTAYISFLGQLIPISVGMKIDTVVVKSINSDSIVIQEGNIKVTKWVGSMPVVKGNN